MDGTVLQVVGPWRRQKPTWIWLQFMGTPLGQLGPSEAFHDSEGRSFAAAAAGFLVFGCLQAAGPHLHARDVSLALVSRAPRTKLEPFRQRMGWTIPWYSSFANDFNADFGMTQNGGEQSGTSVFLREENNVYLTYFSSGRGDEAYMPTWKLLDLTPFGRQEIWEDSPKGWPQTSPYDWWRHHDRYI